MADFQSTATRNSITQRRGHFVAWFELALAIYAVAQLAILLTLVVSHWRFPLFLETMEGSVLQHAARAADGLSIYPTPTLDFVSLAYTPLFYFIATPVIWLFGPELPALRVVATAGYALAIWLVYAATRDRTKSPWWGVVAAGLFAAAYATMDAYLDTAHSDSWMIASVLLGTRMIDRAGTRHQLWLGVAVLCAAFWFKQHGALFAIGGVLYLTLTRGLRDSLPVWAIAALLGPCLYLISPILFGPETHRFTLEIPSSWSTFSPRAILRLGAFVLVSYPVLLLAAGYEYAATYRQRFTRVTIWHVQGVAALASGLMAALDGGGARNTFVPLGVFVIIIGMFGLSRFDQRSQSAGWTGWVVLPALTLAFATLFYSPRPYLPRTAATSQYQGMITALNELDGPVASPSLGQLPANYQLSPAMLWVALDDMERGPRAKLANAARAEALADGLIARPVPHYLLMNEPLNSTRLFDRLAPHYTLERDFEKRFSALAGLPGTYPIRASYPRYLYRRLPEPASVASQPGR
jgi:hypothetical protein